MASPYSNAPDYANERIGGPSGIRVPIEVGKATFAVHASQYLTGLTGTVTLTVPQAASSYLSITNTGATILVYPKMNGHQFTINNLAASSGTVTVEVAGQSATPIAVAAGFLQQFLIDRNLGVVPISAAVAV